jgi:hypothetical protein|tara:strand:+ start:325 stop:528 length:204 start_codon:yes stop_codon:yes gene_type:complete
MKDQMIKTARMHAEAEIQLHKTNIDIYMTQSIGIGEHSDIMETINLELDKMAAAYDRLEMLDLYFKK